MTTDVRDTWIATDQATLDRAVRWVLRVGEVGLAQADRRWRMTKYHITVDADYGPDGEYRKLYDGTDIPDAMAAWSKAVSEGVEYVMLEALADRSVRTLAGDGDGE